MRKIFLRAEALVALLAAGCYAEKLELQLVKEQVIQERLHRGVVPSGKRQGTIHDLFGEVGCPAEEQRVSKRSANVICTLPGETSSTIVIGGHFDFADHGQGIVDDWSGVSLLPSLYQSLKFLPHRHTYVFIAFAAEERGLVGSSFYVKHLSREEKAALHAFVNLECLGLTPPKVWARRSSPVLTTRLLEVANATHITLQGVNVDKVGDDDTHPFSEAKVPVISIHSVTQETFPVLHSGADRLEAVRMEDYYLDPA